MSYPDNTFLPQMLSPTAYEMGRYGRTPVSHFYGLPNITIPLTEVRAKNYKLPVTLSYNAGGHKPEQHPGWTGLGWSFHAGGSIVRVTNGMKDELSTGECNYLFPEDSSIIPNDPGYLQHINEVQTETDWNDKNTLSSKSVRWREFEPDEYIINMDGIHASFYIIGTNKIAIVSKDESVFELEKCEVVTVGADNSFDIYFGKFEKGLNARRYNYIKGFIIRDKRGNRYIFGGDDTAIEYSVVQYAHRGNNEAVGDWKAIATANAWMLTKIERADGEVITFEYEKNGVPIVLRDIHHGELYAEESSYYNIQNDTYNDWLDNRCTNYNFHFIIHINTPI